MANEIDFGVHHYYSQRFSLCVLDTIRLLQKRPEFKKGINLCDIVQSIRERCMVEGDLMSQVMGALQDLESTGFVMKESNGYRTLGPFAKLNLAKTPKQKRLMWKKIEASLGIENDRTDIISEAKRKYCKFINEDSSIIQNE